MTLSLARLQRIADEVGPLVARYHVAKLFGDPNRERLAIGLGGALVSLRGVFSDGDWLAVQVSLGIDPLEAAQLIESVTELLPQKNQDV
jgi:hypothetical protein